MKKKMKRVCLYLICIVLGLILTGLPDLPLDLPVIAIWCLIMVSVMIPMASEWSTNKTFKGFLKIHLTILPFVISMFLGAAVGFVAANSKIVPSDTQIQLSKPKGKLLTNIVRSKHDGKSRFLITVEIDGHEASYQRAFEEKQFNAKAEWVDEETVSVEFIYRDSGETFQTITLRHRSDSPTLELIDSH